VNSEAINFSRSRKRKQKIPRERKRKRTRKHDTARGAGSGSKKYSTASTSLLQTLMESGKDYERKDDGIDFQTNEYGTHRNELEAEMVETWI